MHSSADLPSYSDADWWCDHADSASLDAQKYQTFWRNSIRLELKTVFVVHFLLQFSSFEIFAAW